jgi:hypothetical protein
LELLEREAEQLLAVSVIIEIAVAAGDIRQDGKPRASARPTLPAIVVYILRRNKTPLQFASDAFTGWQDNLRAIALTMENLRAIDRYGVTKAEEQYRGFEAIEAPQAVSRERQCAEVIANYTLKTAEDLLSNFDALKLAYRAACRQTHPDFGGDAEAFKVVQEAYEFLSSWMAEKESQT